MTPKKPNFLIIGSAKCGTTTLAAILDSHPDCCFSRPKEVNFFQDNIDYAPNPNFQRGWEWYSQAFLHYNGEPLVGESTPPYSDRTRSPNTARRVFDFNPEMKVIYMVRDPLKRQVSLWRMQYFFGVAGTFPWRREDKWALGGFEQWMIEQHRAAEWDECRYGFQLEAYREFFPREQILVTFLEDWEQRQSEELFRIACFLQLSADGLKVERPEGLNRAEDRTIERPWFRQLRSSGVIRAAARILPPSLRGSLGARIGTRTVGAPPPDLTQVTKEAFSNYISCDADAFLRECGKPPDFWPSVRHDVEAGCK
jgi:hypothetical protein